MWLVSVCLVGCCVVYLVNFVFNVLVYYRLVVCVGFGLLCLFLFYVLL